MLYSLNAVWVLLISRSDKNLSCLFIKYFLLFQTNAFTLRNTIHYAPTDIPTIFLGSWAKFIYQRLFR